MRRMGWVKLAGIAVAILIAVYAGLRHESILRQVWGPHPTRGWIDVEEERVNRYRRDVTVLRVA